MMKEETLIDVALMTLMMNSKKYIKHYDTIRCIESAMRERIVRNEVKDEKAKKFLDEVGLWDGLNEAVAVANYDSSDDYYKIFKPIRWFVRRMLENEEKTRKFFGEDLYKDIEGYEDMKFDDASKVMYKILEKLSIDIANFE